MSSARKVIIVEISFCARNAIKNETKNVNQNSLFSLTFAIFWVFWPIELRKQHDDLLFLNLIFTYFFIMNNSVKLKEISSTSFYYIIPP